MKKPLIAAMLAAAFTTFVPSVGLAQNLAIVNGKPVPLSRVDALTKQIERGGRKISEDERKKLREEIITREVFMQEAQKRGLDRSEDYRLQMELARQSILIGTLFAEYQKNNPVTEADAKAEYDKYVAANGGKEYKARHILVETEAEARDIIASLKAGGKFEDIARKSSKDPGSGANGGDLDWAAAASYVPEFSQAMVALEKGKITEAPVKSQFGFHVIRLDDTREAQMPKFDDVKPQIMQELQQRKLAAYQQEVRGKAKVQ